MSAYPYTPLGRGPERPSGVPKGTGPWQGIMHPTRWGKPGGGLVLWGGAQSVKKAESPQDPGPIGGEVGDSR